MLRTEIHPSWLAALALLGGLGIGLLAGLFAPVDLLNAVRTPLSWRRLYDHPEVHNYHYDVSPAPIAVPPETPPN